MHFSNFKQYHPLSEHPTTNNIVLCLQEIILGLTNSSAALNAHHNSFKSNGAATPTGWYRGHDT